NDILRRDVGSARASGDQSVTGQNQSRGPWLMEWSSEDISRFWDLYSSHELFSDRYFSFRVGGSVLKAVHRYIGTRTPIVELGAAKGYLTELLLERGAKVLAVDASPSSVATLTSRFQGVPGFLGARLARGELPVDNDCAGGVVLVETIEHLP